MLCQLIKPRPTTYLTAAFLLLGLAVAWMPMASKAADQTSVASTTSVSGPPLTLIVNKSTILRLETPATRISVANPAVADITPINNREIYVLGKSIGNTNLIIWDKTGKATMMDVKVTAEPVPVAPTPTPEEKDSVEVIKGLNKSKMEF